MIPEIIIVNLTGHPLTQQIYNPQEYFILKDMGVIPVQFLEEKIPYLEGKGHFVEIDVKDFCKV